MNLLNYTRKLREKFNFYDTYSKDNFESSCNNPFFKKEAFDITIIWVQDNDKKT